MRNLALIGCRVRRKNLVIDLRNGIELLFLAISLVYRIRKSSIPRPTVQTQMKIQKSSSSEKLRLLLEKINRSPETIKLDEALDAISDAYEFTPVAFSNGPLINAAGDKVRSCMLYAFGRLHDLSESQMLACFGEHYREVLDDPEGASHMTIRVFIKGGWSGVRHETMPLKSREKSV